MGEKSGTDEARSAAATTVSKPVKQNSKPGPARSKDDTVAQVSEKSDTDKAPSAAAITASKPDKQKSKPGLSQSNGDAALEIKEKSSTVSGKSALATRSAAKVLDKSDREDVRSAPSVPGSKTEKLKNAQSKAADASTNSNGEKSSTSTSSAPALGSVLQISDRIDTEHDQSVAALHGPKNVKEKSKPGSSPSTRDSALKISERSCPSSSVGEKSNKELLKAKKEIDKLNRRLQEKEQYCLTVSLDREQADQEMDTLHKEVRELKQQNASVEMLKRDLLERLSRQKEVQECDISNLEEKLNVKQQRIEEETVQKKEYFDLVQSLEKQLQTVQQQNRGLEGIKASHTERIASLEEERKIKEDNFQKQLDTIESKANQTNAQNDMLKTEVQTEKDNKKKLSDKWEKDKSELLNNTKTVEQAYTSLQEKYDKKEAECNSLQSKSTASAQQVESLKFSLAQINKLQAENKSLEEEKVGMRLKLKKQASAAKEQGEALEKKVKELSTLAEDKSRLEASFEIVNTRKKKLEEELKKAKGDKASDEPQKVLIQKLQVLNDKLEKEAKQANLARDEAQKNQAEDKEALMRAFKEAKDHHNVVKTLSKEIRSLKEEVAKLKDEKKEKDRMNIVFENDVEDKKK